MDLSQIQIKQNFILIVFIQWLSLQLMFTKRQIKALISIGVIFMMMLHMVIPHAHHHHEEEKELAHHHAEHHHDLSHESDHAHSHEHDTKNERNTVSFSFPLEKHLHAFHIHEFVHTTKNRSKQVSEKTLSFQAALQLNSIHFQNANKQSYRFAFYRRIIYENPFTKQNPLRGPPRII